MVGVFDLGGPLIAYALLRSAGMSAVTALVISGVLPALGIAIGVWADRRLDVMRQPLIFRLAVELIGPGTAQGRDIAGAWRYPGFRRAFAVITAAWGPATLPRPRSGS